MSSADDRTPAEPGSSADPPLPDEAARREARRAAALRANLRRRKAGPKAG